MTKLILVSLQDVLPPLGLCYLASYYFAYGRANVEIEIQDNRPNASIESIAGKVRGADLVGISCLTQEFNKVVALCKEIKGKYGIPIILGGHHVSDLPHILPSEADIAVLGEGEQTMLELLELYERYGFQKERLKEIKGIAYHDEGGVELTGSRELVEPLDTIPPPARHLLELKRYLRPRWVFGTEYKVGTHIMTSRGCPYKCVFCSASSFWKRARFFSAEYVVSEISDLIQRYNVKAINIYDDLFLANRLRARKIAELIDKQGITREVELFMQARANLIDEQACELMKQMNVVLVSLGIETGSEKILRYLKKGTVTVEDNRRAVKLCREYGMSVDVSLMIGSPGETSDDLLETVSFVKDLDIRGYIQIFLATPFPGTELWEYAKLRGVVDEHMDWSKLTLDTPEGFKDRVIVSDELSREQLWNLAEPFIKSVEIHNWSLWKFQPRRLFDLAYLRDFISRPKEFASRAIKVLYCKLRARGKKVIDDGAE